MSSESDTEYDFTKYRREEIKFKGFHQLVKELKVNALKQVNTDESTQKNIDDTKTYTFDALMKWKEDDRSQGFYDAFYSIRKDVTTLPLLLYNKDNVVKNILFHLNVKDTLAIHSLLNLTIQLCRDIRQFFYPYVSSFLDYFKTKLIGCDDVTIISDIFTTISFIIKYMYQDILESIDDFMKTYIFFLCHHKSYVRAFAAESMSYLLRKMTP
ncbi:Small subunit processome component 20-like protein [Entamoeba marina]